MDDYYACFYAVGNFLQVSFDGVFVRDLEEGVQGEAYVHVGVGERGWAGFDRFGEVLMNM